MYYRKISIVTKVFLPLAVLLGLWMLFNLCSCQGLAGADSNRTGADALELRVMSFNIRYGSANDGENHWKNRREMVFDVFRNHRPDIVGVQEALDFQIAEIRKAVTKYGQIGVAREDGKTDGEYSAILYPSDHFPVTAILDLPANSKH
jgi:endonuclease/exonuclease/phosphatase family metal-dependent hydrolase